MKQALHIFRKDVRHLWPRILAGLGTLAAFSYILETQPPLFSQDFAGRDTVAWLLAGVLLLSWCYLIASVVFDDRLPGDRQFWVTRPYSRASLLTAKALFILVFVNIPFLISDCVLVRLQGFQPGSAATDLLWRQVALTGAFVLPAAAVAAVTSGLAQFALAGFLVLACFFVEQLAGSRSLGRFEWTLESMVVVILLLAALVILPWQYMRRQTAAARGVLACGLVLCAGLDLVKPAGTALAIQSHFPSPPPGVSAVGIAYAPDPVRISSIPSVEWTRVQIPFDIRGLPSGTGVAFDLMNARAERADGTSWESGWYPWHDWYESGGAHHVALWIDSHPLDKWKSGPVKLRLSLALTIFEKGNTVTVTPRTQTFPVAGVGLCSITPFYGPMQPILLCRSPLGPTSRIRLRFEGERASRLTIPTYPFLRQDVPLVTAPNSPYRATWGLAPVFSTSAQIPGAFVEKWDRSSNSFVFSPGFTMVFTSERPIAHIRRDLVIPNVRPGDYTVEKRP